MVVSYSLGKAPTLTVLIADPFASALACLNATLNCPTGPHRVAWVLGARIRNLTLATYLEGI